MSEKDFTTLGQSYEQSITKVTGETYVFNLFEICLFDQTLMKKQGVVVHDIYCILWARSGSGSSSELFGFRWILRTTSASIGAISYGTHPESDFIHTDSSVTIQRLRQGKTDADHDSHHFLGQSTSMERCSLRFDICLSGMRCCSSNVSQNLEREASERRSELISE